MDVKKKDYKIPIVSNANLQASCSAFFFILCLLEPRKINFGLSEAKILSKIINKINKEIWISFTCNDKLELRDGSSLKKACKIFSSTDNVSTIGINCVQPHLISDVIKLLKKESTKNILVYPNSGEKFDHKTKTWNG